MEAIDFTFIFSGVMINTVLYKSLNGRHILHFHKIIWKVVHSSIRSIYVGRVHNWCVHLGHVHNWCIHLGRVHNWCIHL